MVRTRFWSVFLVSAIVAGVAGHSSVVLAQRPATTARPAAAEPTPEDRVARGRYIVEGVATCWRCHSPVLGNGERDTAHWLMGGQVGIQPTVPSGDWAIVAPRLAGAPPGTDEQFVHLLMTGVSRRGNHLRLPMPQFRMTQSDAEAVLVYLKSLGGQIPNATR
jgi:mono/diheme cytochrome c family protein